MASSSSSAEAAASEPEIPDQPHHVLQLSDQRIDFEPVSKNVSVFYDEANKQVFIVLDRGSEAIIVKNSDGFVMKFSIQDRGNIYSIKFSPGYQILSLQRADGYVEFFLFKDSQPTDLFVHKMKKAVKILGFFWTNATELAVISDQGIEFFQVLAEKKCLKSLKTFSLSVEWFVFQPLSGILLIANGTFANVIHPFLFRPSTVYKLTKFEIDWSLQAKNANLSLQERDVTMANLYRKPRLLILRHHPISKDQSGAHIMVYTFQKRDSPPQKTDILITNATGRFAINIVDDLIVVHHQTPKTSMIFDLNMPCNEIITGVKYHQPVIPRCVIKPYKINNVLEYDLYSPNWVIFQPDIIIDAKYGCLWFLELNLDAVCHHIRNVPILIDFLLLRRHSKPIILKVCRSVIGVSRKYGQNPIGNLSLIFNKLNLAYNETLSSGQSQQQQATDFDYLKPSPLPQPKTSATIIDQKDMLSSFFEYFEEDGVENNLGIAIVFEYITSLTTNDITVQFFIYEFLINILVKTENYYQMHQFLQYHVFADSKPLACLLLSLHQKFPYAIQIGLDMLKRLKTADDEIVEVLLAQNQIIRALQYISRHHDIYAVSARKFLEAALATKDPLIFHQVYKFFQLRNLKLRNSSEFVKGENCDQYEKQFEKLFGSKVSFLL